MTESDREVVERFTDAHIRKDREAGSKLLHPDFELRWPQSGEVIRGPANWRAVFENYPEVDKTALEPTRTLGSEDRWVMTPSFTMLRLSGAGDTYTQEGTVTYPNGERWHYVAVIEVRDGAIWRETDYFAPPFEAPSWRAPWVE